MKKIDLSNFDLEQYVESIDIDKIKNVLSDNKYKKITDRIELLIKSDVSTIKKYLNLANYYNKEEKEEILNAFNYKNYRSNKPKFMNHFKKLNLKSCPFCNNNYIYFYKENANEEYNTLATLEHYYPKAKFPYLSLSFYNLIPSCSICNSKFKGKDEDFMGQISHPYKDDFDENTDFKISINNAIVKKDEDINIELKSNDEKCKKSIERFQLDKVYEEHTDIAKEIWNKAQVYNDSRIEELYKEFYSTLGYTKEDVKNMIFCNYLKKEDINKRNHAKLTQDILKQFEI